MVPCIESPCLYASGRQTPLVKENWEGRRPKTRDKHGSQGSSNSLQPRRKLGRTLLDLTSMNNEVEVNYYV
jgi:mTERF domain-containing protein